MEIGGGGGGISIRLSGLNAKNDFFLSCLPFYLPSALEKQMKFSMLLPEFSVLSFLAFFVPSL